MEHVSWDQISNLFDSLEHSSVDVKRTALNALVRLPLDRDQWLDVAKYVNDKLQPLEERGFPESLTLSDIPLDDLIGAASFIPVRSVRRTLYRLLDSDDRNVSLTVAENLALAQDQKSLGHLVDELPNIKVERLALLDLADRVNDVKRVYKETSVPEIRLWLTVALARAGESGPLKRVLKELNEGKLETEGPWGDHSYFNFENIVPDLGKMPERDREFLGNFSNNPSNDPIARGIADQLYRVGSKPKKVIEPKRLPANPELEELARRVEDQIKKRNESDKPLDEQLLRTDLIPYLRPNITPEFVNIIFQKAFDPQSKDWLISNEITREIYSIRHSFEPDVDSLYRLILQSWKGEGDKYNLEHILLPHIAWTVSQANLDKILDGLKTSLGSQDEKEKEFAAVFLRSILKYSSTDYYPPQFGGESDAPDLAPDTSEFIEDEEMAEANGGDRKETKPPNGDAKPENDASPERKIDIGLGGNETRINWNDDVIVLDSSETKSKEEIKKPVVNMNFTPKENPDPTDIEQRQVPLIKNKEYFFWLSIGDWEEGSINPRENSSEFNTDNLPPEAIIDVVLFGYEGEIKITSNADIGKLKIASDGKIIVDQPVVKPTNLPDPNNLENHLFFPVQMPNEEGSSRIRCNLYFENVLLQSHVMTVMVVDALSKTQTTETDVNNSGANIEFNQEFRWSNLDYSLSNTLETKNLTKIEKHSLSIMLNDGGNGTHNFRIFGGQEKRWDVSISESSLESLIKTAREGLRKVSWGNEKMWGENQKYRYETKTLKKRKQHLKKDFVTLAKRGQSIFLELLRETIFDEASGDFSKLESYKETFWNAKNIQIAASKDINQVIPTAMVYDSPFDDSLDNADYSLCKVFENALGKKNINIEDTICFKNQCPDFNNDTVICPSGFWGFRLNIGLPFSISEGNDESKMALEYKHNPKIALMVYKDFATQQDHVQNLRNLKPEFEWTTSDSGSIIKTLLKENMHIIYFYCHGGLTSYNKPYLQVGNENDPNGIITSDYVLNKGIKWNDPRPLVFINGCHTTALEPNKALNFIENLVPYSGAVGVIGTEITIFESLATEFAENCLKQFFNGSSIGKAIRLARLQVLQNGNPLGLVYIPFVISSLKLVHEK